MSLPGRREEGRGQGTWRRQGDDTRKDYMGLEGSDGGKDDEGVLNALEEIGSNKSQPKFYLN